MSPPLWIVSVPLGYVNVFWPRFASLYLTVSSGIELDVANPRKQMEGEEVATKDSDGRIARAYSAHQNGWEAMSMWVAAVLLAYVMDVDEDKMNAVAGVWLVSRILYNILYILISHKKLAATRSLAFAVGLVCSFVLMWSAIQNS